MSVLGERWHCVAADLRGFRAFRGQAGGSAPGVRDLTDDLHALLADSDLVPDGQRVHLLGWSLGRGVVL